MAARFGAAGDTWLPNKAALPAREGDGDRSCGCDVE